MDDFILSVSTIKKDKSSLIHKKIAFSTTGC
jgi:hypothetical protein